MIVLQILLDIAEGVADYARYRWRRRAGGGGRSV